MAIILETQRLLLRHQIIEDLENEASKRVAEKIGMKFEKEARDEMDPFLVYSIDQAGDI